MRSHRHILRKISEMNLNTDVPYVSDGSGKLVPKFQTKEENKKEFVVSSSSSESHKEEASDLDLKSEEVNQNLETENVANINEIPQEINEVFDENKTIKKNNFSKKKK